MKPFNTPSKTAFAVVPGLPLNQLNAVLDPGIIMRVGVPQKGGGVAFHTFNEGYPAMVSANAFWNISTNEFKLPKATDLTEIDWALDSAGYTAMKMWQAKGAQKGMAGIFPWTYEQYVEFASETGSSWWSQPDLCCEPEIARNQEEIDYRIDATATLLEGVLQVVYAWQCELAGTCSPDVIANMLKPPVPVLQGWSANDYLRSLELMKAVWSRWEPWLAPPGLIGIGSVCRRNLHHPEHCLYAILEALDGKLPKGTRVHLFGVKGSCLANLKKYNWIAIADSMAWDLGSRIKAHKTGTSNSVAHKSVEMTRWMTAANDMLNPTADHPIRNFR